MKYLVLTILIAVFTPLIISSAYPGDKGKTLSGADVLITSRMDLIRGKRLGIVTNHSALLSNGAHLVDTLFHTKDVKISALFGPEHGIRGNAPDGAKVESGRDANTGIQVYSLYGKINKPTKEMLKDVDVLIYDIQDVGARFYTFISTLFYTVQAGAENNIPVIILDRPNPITGITADGPIRKEGLSSFVGIAPIPIMHGLTIGELAAMFNKSGMIGRNIKANLTVVKMENWQRD
ncbi:MAG: exo-beta-N-acetylmuramidase NamZ domain-containing protein, partial [Ignavibacteriales bacterium]